MDSIGSCSLDVDAESTDISGIKLNSIINTNWKISNICV